jgi:hypothetical protein
LKPLEMKNAALAVFGEKLEGTGFRRLGKRSIYAKENAPGIEARLNFKFSLDNLASIASIQVNAEIHHKEIEKVRKLITGESAFTILAYLRSLMRLAGSPPDSTWTFWGPKAIPSLAENIADAAIGYGVPFLARFTTLGDVITYLETVSNQNHYTMEQSLAIAYCIQGRPDGAVGVLASGIDKARTSPRWRREIEKYIELFDLPIELG